MISNDQVTSILNSNLNPNGTFRTPQPELDADDFLTMLVTQMQYQDPLDPMDQQAFMGDLAQFNVLQQSIELNEAFIHFMQFQELTQATSMIGKNVVALANDANGDVLSAEGLVVEVFFTTSGAYLRLDDDSEVSIQDVINVKLPEE